MIVNLPETTSREVAKRLVALRHEMGAVTLGRVLTLIVVVDEDGADEALEVANDATRQSPSRILILVRGPAQHADRLDGQIRIGGDAGASEIIVLRLYGRLVDQGRSVLTPLLLADAPIVAWWPAEAPDNVAESTIGEMAHHRVTDAAATHAPRTAIASRVDVFRPGDTDMAWTRVTRWRTILAAALDQAPFEPVTEVVVSGASDSASTDLLAAWLGDRLRCPVTRTRTEAGVGVISARLQRASGPIDLVRVSPQFVTLSQPRQPVRRMALSRPTKTEALEEELRRLDPDQVYERTLRKGLALLPSHTPTMSAAVRAGQAPDVDQARKAGEAARRAKADVGGSKVVKPPSDRATQTDVKHAADRQLDARREQQESETR